MGLNKKEAITYANVLSDGKIRIASDERNPNAVKREYETSDGVKGVKYEEVFDSLSGVIKNLFIFEGDYGKTLQVTIDDIVLCLNMTYNFADDFLKKLPNIDLAKEVMIVPYSFEDKAGKTRKGLTITQDNEKVVNFFYDLEKKKTVNGYPALPKGYEKFDSDDWKAYFIGCRKFLVKYMEDNILPKMPAMSDLVAGATEKELEDEIANLNFSE